MFRLKIILCLTFTYFETLDASVEQFLYNDLASKCCKPEEILSIAPSSGEQFPYQCVPNINRTLRLESRSFLLNFPNKSFSHLTSCLDVIENEQPDQKRVVKIYSDLNTTYLDVSYFPKCCPTDSAYDLLEHKCVILNKTKNPEFMSFTEEVLNKHISKGLLLIKAGLSECRTVIANYELPSFDDILFNDNKGIFLRKLNETVSYGNYCVDKVYNSQTYVMRVCHQDLSVCKKKKSDKDKLKCIRKCCPDGKILTAPYQCEFNFEHGLNFDNESRIKNTDESFATIQQPRCDVAILIDKSQDEYYLDERGNVRITLGEGPLLFYSLFKPTYCYEYFADEDLQGMHMLICN